MVGRRGYRGNCGGGMECELGERTASQTAAEEMSMCRHVHPINTSIGCCSVEKQLWELNQVLDYQNKILVELLQAIRDQTQRI